MGPRKERSWRGEIAAVHSVYSARLLHREGCCYTLRDLEIRPDLPSASPGNVTPKVFFLFRDLHLSPIGPDVFPDPLNLVNIAVM
jgi:hypothetical protein